MIKRDLPDGTPISVIGVGAFAMGGWMWGAQQDDDSRAALHAALDAGVTWIDTAPIYGDGRADALVAEVLKIRQDRPLVFHKCGHRLVDGQRVTDGSRERIIADCEQQLRAFGVECLDLLQLHWPGPQPIAETAGVFAELKRAGKIRRVGVSNFSRDQLAAWTAAGGPLDTVQNKYSILDSQAEADVLPWCAEHAVGFLAYSPLARGLLTGTWDDTKVFPPGDHRGDRAEYGSERRRQLAPLLAELARIAEEEDVPVAAVAIGALLCTEGLAGVIVGARTAEQGSLLGDYAYPLRQRDLDSIAAALTACGG